MFNAQKENLNLSQNATKRPITVGKHQNERGISAYNKDIAANPLISPRIPHLGLLQAEKISSKIPYSKNIKTHNEAKIGEPLHVLKSISNNVKAPCVPFVTKKMSPCGPTKSPSAKALKHLDINALNSSLITESKNSIQDYTIGKSIGQGAYATVKEAVHKITGKKMAVKIYDKFKLLDAQRKKSVLNEIKILKRLDHKNIVQIYDSIDNSKQLFLIMEYAQGISLHAYSKTKPCRKFPEIECRKIFRQVVSAIDYCHQRGICHRDIKMDNIIIDRQLRVKLIDFGFSTYSGKEQLLRIYCGTPSYMSPEIVTKTPYNGLKADMWALGILLYALLEGTYPFKSPSDKDLYKKIAKGAYSMPDTFSKNATLLITRLLQVDPNKRICAEMVLCDAFMADK
jgi:tRNA A-37 threonylcarbamoyl transferase component Bud32